MKSLFYEENSTDLGHPGLLTACKDRNGVNTGVYGPLDISKSSTFEFLSNLFDEIYTVFPDEMIHLGGDEVELDDCWYNLFLKAIIYKNDMWKPKASIVSHFSLRFYANKRKHNSQYSLKYTFLDTLYY